MPVLNVEQEQRRLMKREGFESVFDLKRQPKRAYYREDGSLVGVLPADPYHFQLYMGKGWTLESPAAKKRKSKKGAAAPVLTAPEPGVDAAQEGS